MGERARQRKKVRAENHTTYVCNLPHGVLSTTKIYIILLWWARYCYITPRRLSIQCKFYLFLRCECFSLCPMHIHAVHMCIAQVVSLWKLLNFQIFENVPIFFCCCSGVDNLENVNGLLSTTNTFHCDNKFLDGMRNASRKYFRIKCFVSLTSKKNYQESRYKQQNSIPNE